MIIAATMYGVAEGGTPTNNLSFSGASAFESVDDHFEMHLFSSGVLTVKTEVTVDACLVAGGKPGASGGGNGGNGGEVKTVTALTLAPGEYTVTIGGSNEDTTITGNGIGTITAVSGNGSRGSTGTGSAAARNGADGVLAWNDEHTLIHAGWKYGPGGGRGQFEDQYNQNPLSWASGPGGSVGSASDDETIGHGGTSAHKKGYDGLANTGGGAGGGYKVLDYRGVASGSSGGVGGSGCLMIRDART